MSRSAWPRSAWLRRVAGRKRRHESDVERARAYRHRRQLVIDAGTRLAAAVHRAAESGDSLAAAVDHSEAAATLDALAAYFEGRSGEKPVT